MKLTPTVVKILANYESENPGVKTKLANMLMHGKLAGTGKMIILPVDQGFEHGPARSFTENPAAFDPHYHYRLAVEAGLSAYAAPLGALEAGADTFAGQIPTILKINSSNTLYAANNTPDQAVTATVEDALRLGCTAIGFTIYPGSTSSLEQMEELKDLAARAKSYGLAVIVWSYPRGNLSKAAETGIDVISYGAHMAALLGAHIIKVKLPEPHIECKETKDKFDNNAISISSLADRVNFVVKSCFNGRRIVVFSGGGTKSDDAVIEDAVAIEAGGGNGSIIGRNCFQRPYEEACILLDKMVKVYKTK